MSLARLSAGAGYKYLLRHTACGDACREQGTGLAAYYAALGYPVGRWFGSGLAGLDDGRGVAAASVVTEEAMAALYGRGHDPLTAEPLGRPYPEYRGVGDRIAGALAELPDELGEDERAVRSAEIDVAERARPVRSAVAGFDLTFTVPKSASVLCALGDREVQVAVMEAHRAAVAAVLGLIEDRFLHTRVGHAGCAQVPTRGMVATAFDHWDTRTGDPNLHTHVVIANKVQGPDGRWRSVDGKVLFGAAVALSEVYDDLVADAISARLPVAWSWRERGARRSPAFEIDGLPDGLLAAFSTRSGQITVAVQQLITEFRQRHDRDPNRREVLRLRQQATLATRPDKVVRPPGELIGRWRATATALTGAGPEQLVEAVLTAPGFQGPVDVVALAHEVLTGVVARRSTWTRANLLAESARASRHLRMPTPGARFELLDRIVEAALAQCVALDPPELFEVPHRFRRADGTSVFTRPEEHVFTTTGVLAAEDRLVAATATLGAPAVGPDVLAPVLGAAAVGMPGARGLTPDQTRAVKVTAGSGRLLDVLVGPAGSGKTRTLRALRAAWEHAHGPGSVLGLAPSATAATELAASLAIGCENTTKWLHEHGTRPDDPRWSLRAGQLVVVDEASMVTTDHLDRLVAAARDAGAKVLLVGDHHQLDAVGAGGAFALLADTEHTQTLTGLWRFTHRWEAHATRGLREGRPDALNAYAAHGRLHDGPGDLMLDAAYTVWATDIAAGHSALLLAADRTTVTALNTRAHNDRVNAGHVTEDGIALADDTTAGRGDIVVTRRNNRRITLDDGGHVRNGALWTVHDVHPDGALDVVPTGGGQPIRLPAEYVREHVELGYAATVHRAQGMTVDRTHVLATGAMTRQSLYVAMTRGRQANHVYVALDSVDGTCAYPGGEAPLTGHQVLEGVLATDGAERSATATLRHRQDHVTSRQRLQPIRDLLSRAETDPAAAEAIARIDEIVRQRAADRTRNHHGQITGPQHEGLHR